MKSQAKTRKVVLIQGAFEILNYGHVRAFKRARAMGTHLIVALNSNKLLKEYKKRDAVMPWKQKKVILEGIRYVDQVVEARNFSPMKLLKKYDVDVYVLTKEWELTKAEEIAYMKKKGGRISFSPRYAGVVCTSDIKRILLAEAKAAEPPPKPPRTKLGFGY